VFQVQSEVAEQVASALDIALADTDRRTLARTPTSNPEAYDYYLRGNDYFERGYGERTLRVAEEMYEKALRLDPGFASAWAGLSQVHDGLYWFYYDRSDKRLAAVKETAERSLRLEPDLPAAHVAMGFYYYHGLLDYDRALKEFAIALERGHRSVAAAIGFVQRRQGKWPEALANLQKAFALDPRSATLAWEVAGTHWVLRSYAEAERYVRRAIELGPEQAGPYGYLAAVYLSWKGDRAAIRKAIAEGLTRVSADEIVPTLSQFGFWQVLLIAAEEDSTLRVSPPKRSFGSDTAAYFEWRAALAGAGRQGRLQQIYADSARVLLEARVKSRPEDPVFHGRLGIAYAILGRKPDAVREGKAGVELLPLAKDANHGVFPIYFLARIYAMVGEQEAAVEQLGFLLSVPSFLSIPWLRADPTWDLIRANPGFKKLIGDES
jgi:tetratricopeptide (TPR) repeat protein